MDTNVYKGLVYCGDCGKLMHFNNRGKGQYRYLCIDKECKNCNSITKRMLDDILREEIKKLRSIILTKEKEKSIEEEFNSKRLS